MITRRRSPELYFWSAMPFFTAALLMLVGSGRTGLPAFSGINPLYALAALYYWCIHQPREMPLWAAFIVGLVQDALTGMPTGITALTYVLYLAMLHPQRRMMVKSGFLPQWFMFSASVALVELFRWLLMSLLSNHLFPVTTLVLPWLVLTLLYPALHKLFDWLHHVMARRRWALTHGR